MPSTLGPISSDHRKYILHLYNVRLLVIYGIITVCCVWCLQISSYCFIFRLFRLAPSTRRSCL